MRFLHTNQRVRCVFSTLSTDYGLRKNTAHVIISLQNCVWYGIYCANCSKLQIKR